MEIVALLTGRGGSSLKDKNVLNLKGMPVLSYPCIEAKKSKNIGEFFVSSDDNKILKTANKFGFIPIKRPKKYSKHDSKHYDVLIHALKKLHNQNIYPDILVILLANAPIIKVKWIDDCINLIKKKKASCVLPVIKDNDKHPLRAKKKSNKYLIPYVNSRKNISSNRQDLEDCYFVCHNFWVIHTESIFKNNGYPPWNFMGKKVLGYPIKFSQDIHNAFDIKICELLLNKKFKF